MAECEGHSSGISGWFHPDPELLWGGEEAPHKNTTACKVAMFRDVLPPGLLIRVREDVLKVLESDYSPPPNPNSLTFGTFWWSPHALPCNAIEEAIAWMREAVLPGVLEVGAMAGAEWWLQDTDCDDQPKEFHTDCDVQVADDGSSMRRHPCMSSVFYLDSMGGGTVVAGQAKGPEGDLSPPLPRDMAVAFPHPNQLLVFGGELYHAVLHPNQEFPHGASRRTLLVNWWPSRPSGPADLPHAFSFARSGREVLPPSTGPPASAPRPVRFLALVMEGPFVEHLAEWAGQRLPAAIPLVAAASSSVPPPGSKEDGALTIATPLFLRYSEDGEDAAAATEWRAREWSTVE